MIAVFHLTSTAEAHGGGLNRCGCHFNRKTGQCHCHQDRGCGCDCQPARCK
ncbi:MAG: YHYH domain-containing protein [Myxococcales bacterium]|nr:YHYH domain-containing protein [Myxococcales bacterium]